MAGGYFVEPVAEGLRSLFGTQSNGTPLSALKDVPCLVLLGDVGMGKTVVTSAEADALAIQLSGQKHEIVRRDLKRLTEEQIYRQVFGHPKVESWIRGEHALTLFLDSLDECWRRIDELESILVGELEKHLQRDRPPLFLRLTCRSAEWRGEAGKSLERLFPKKGDQEQLRIYTLASLTQNDVLQAAAVQGLGGEDFLQRVADKDAQALASHPITLEMLFHILLEGGDFPASRVELYERGCLRLCAEPHSDFNSQQQRRMTPAQRLAVAGRLAALSVLTNRYLINGDAECPLSRRDVLETTQAFGHFKESAEGGQLEVDRSATTEALQTALFSERVEGVQTWRHQSYAEFLAAKYLDQRGVPVEQIATLLTDTSDNANRLIPQLEETACWLADMQPAVFDALAPTNADTFIRCDPAILNDRRRALLVERYLGLVRKHDAPEVDWQLKHRLARMNHQSLAAQLGQVITDRGEHTLVREAAIEIAAWCKCTALSDELIDTFLDQNDKLRLRTRAGFALEQLSNDKIRSTLKRKAIAESLNDPNDDVKGCYLRILWPSHLSLNELLVHLTPPKKRNLTGSYRGFFEFELPKSLPDSALPVVLDWLREKKVNFDFLTSYGHFPSKITSRAFELLDDPKICHSFIELLKSQGDRLHHFFRGPISDLEPQAKARQSFWVAVVESGVDLRKLIPFGYLHQAGLLIGEDIPFFIKRYRKTTSESQRNCWRTLIFQAFNPADPAALEDVSNLANIDKAVGDELAARTSYQLVPDERNWVKQDFERRMKAEVAEGTERNPAFDERVEAAVAAFERGVTRAFWDVAELLQSDPDEPNDRVVFPNIRLLDGKAWKALQPELRRRIISAVPSYIRAQDVRELDPWDVNVLYRPYSAVHPLLVLLYDESREALTNLDAELWKKWVPVLISYYGHNNGEHDEAYDFILKIVSQQAKAELLTALEQFLLLRMNDDHKRVFIWRMGAIWCDDIKAIVLRTLRERPLQPTAAQDLLQLMHEHEPTVAREQLELIWNQRRNPEASSVLVPVVGSILLTAFPQEWSPRLVTEFAEDAPLGKAVLWRALRRSRQAKDWLSKLPPETTASLWLWMETQFPGNPYDDDDQGDELRAMNVTSAHDMYHFRRGVLENLITRGTRAACAAMADLMRKRPQDFWLGDILADMRKAARRTTWVCSNPVELMRALANSESRLIRTAGDLHTVLSESIRRFEEALHGSPPSLELWNELREGRNTIWSPKDESNLSTRLKFHIERDLDRRGILASREVQIRPRLGDDAAQLVDVLVAAVPFMDDGKPGKPVSVVVEVKCAWNTGVMEDMEKQLYARYLGNNQVDFGIYVVAYFTCSGWNRERDVRRSRGASRMNFDELRANLRDQARALSSSEKLVESVVIDARLTSG